MRRLVIILVFLTILCGGCKPKEEIALTIPGTTAQLIMRLMPKGTFNMGSPDWEVDRDGDEGPRHLVTITKAFYIGIYEVTQEQWDAVMGSNPSNFIASGNPVECVSWDDCQAFIAEINKLGIGEFRLPTEAEWEYSCRAGSLTRFSFGDDSDYSEIEEYAWYTLNSSGSTHPVGEKLPNTWGLYDMHGNVWEWCNDWSGAYDSSSQTDPQGPTSGETHILRGGGWNMSPRHCRSASRSHDFPVSMSNDLGFRLVRMAP